MLRVLCALYIVLTLFVNVVRAESAVKISGDAQAFATASSGAVGGLNNANSGNHATCSPIAQRYRLKADFAASDNLTFRLAVKTNAGIGQTR